MLPPVESHRSGHRRSIAGAACRCVGAAVFVTMLALPSAADTAYVTDILRLGLHNAPDTSDQPFTMLVSGTELDVIERSRFYALVRTPGGQEGWVKAGYLIDEKPAQAQLSEATSERDAMRTELNAMRARFDEQVAELASLTSEKESLQSLSANTRAELETVSADNAALSKKVAASRLSVPLHWALLAIAAVLGGGVAGGWFWSDYQQRKRHGGFRI